MSFILSCFCVTNYGPLFSVERTLFSISYKTSLLVMNFLNFCPSRKIFLSLLFMMNSFACILDWQGFFGKILQYNTLDCKISSEKSTSNLIATPLYKIHYFSLANFKVLSLALIFNNLIITLSLYNSNSVYMENFDILILDIYVFL